MTQSEKFRMGFVFGLYLNKYLVWIVLEIVAGSFFLFPVWCGVVWCKGEGGGGTSLGEAEQSDNKIEEEDASFSATIPISIFSIGAPFSTAFSRHK